MNEDQWKKIFKEVFMKRTGITEEYAERIYQNGKGTYNFYLDPQEEAERRLMNWQG